MAASAPDGERENEFDQSLSRCAICSFKCEVILAEVVEAGDQAPIGEPFSNGADTKLRGGAGVKVVYGFILNVAEGADSRMVTPFFSHTGRDGVVYQFEGMVSEH